LASKAGMSEYKFSKLDVETEKKVKRSEKIFQLFFNYCHKNIFTEENKNHLDYLLNRSLKKATIENFPIRFL